VAPWPSWPTLADAALGAVDVRGGVVARSTWLRQWPRSSVPIGDSMGERRPGTAAFQDGGALVAGEVIDESCS
jgi:hypothetical protein